MSEALSEARAFLLRLRGSALAAYCVPFLVFMILLEPIRWFRIENELLPWWRQYPEQWGYPLQTVICIGLVLFWRHHYPAFSRRGMGIAVIGGVVGIFLWLLPPMLHHATAIGDSVSWLRWLGFRERLEGFDPAVFPRDEQPLAHFSALFFRLIRLAVAVPLLEEIFWRGFLMRYLLQGEKEWTAEPIGRYGALSFWLTTFLFATAHAGPDFFPALLYGALAGWVTVMTKNLWAAVIMHAVANATLGTFILATGWNGLW